MWDWFFETVEMVWHERLNENENENGFEVVNDEEVVNNDDKESRERANAVGGSEEDLSSFIKYRENEESPRKIPLEKIENCIEEWENSDKNKNDFIGLTNVLLECMSEIYTPDKLKDEMEHEQESVLMF